MTFSILWVVLATTVTVVAIMRRSAPNRHEQGDVQIRQSGKVLGVVAIVYSVVLLAGFLYIGWQHGIDLIK